MSYKYTETVYLDPLVGRQHEESIAAHCQAKVESRRDWHMQWRPLDDISCSTIFSEGHRDQWDAAIHPQFCNRAAPRLCSIECQTDQY